jgi:hypothetical protein
MHEIFFPKIYEIPRTTAAREPCVDFAAAKNTVRSPGRPCKNNHTAFTTLLNLVSIILATDLTQCGFKRTQLGGGLGQLSTAGASAAHCADYIAVTAGLLAVTAD